jgi:DNA-binding CsgD family transcriptional regulator
VPGRFGVVPEVFGRESELSMLRGFVAADRPRGALLLTGAAGIGKTALWEAGLALARDAGRRVMATRASGAEASMAFAGLIDLCEAVGSAELDELPRPQRGAFEAALLRTEPPGGSPPDPHAIALAYLNVLRTMAVHQPLLLAVDDVPWLDEASTSVFVFAARRLRDEPVAFLLTRRTESASSVELAVTPERLDVGPLDTEAQRRLLAARLGVFPSRVLLRRIADLSQGNALFALELGRAVRAAGSSGGSQDVILPDTVDNALDARAAGLASGVRRVLLAVALTGGMTRVELEAVGGRDSVDAAFDDGVLIREGLRVRASHPLLAAAAVKNSTPAERREVHIAVADAVADEELSALNLALASERSDARLATRLADAASRAAARGARPQAVVLAEHALRITGEETAEAGERLLALAAHLFRAGEERRMTDLISGALDRLPAGTPRARALLLLCDGTGVTTLEQYQRQLDRVLAEENVDSAVRAQALALRAEATAVVAVRAIPQAARWAQDALAADGADGGIERRLLHSLAWITALAGQPIDEMCGRFRAVSPDSVYLANSPERVAAQRLVWRGELDAARIALMRLLQQADDQGEGASYALQRLHLCELELRMGDWDAAARLLEEWALSAERELLNLPMYERCRALLAMGRGDVDDARVWAGRTLARADAYGDGWDRLEALRARGAAALLALDPAEAAGDLGAVREHTEREGVRDPGVFPVAPDLVEALVELGDLAGARTVTDTLRGHAEEQAHPWGLVTARRCRALVRLAAPRYDRSAGGGLAAAADDLERMGLRFDAARCLLSLGRAQRRMKQWGTARTSLERAAAGFAQLGSTGWEQRVQTELARVGGRSPAAPGALTPTEQDIVELAAQGLTNKDIARRLSIAVHTVEVHLSRAYAKLGVHTRSQLAARLQTPDTDN